MNETTHGTDLLAATRFVQAGRLSEATALLQRLLRGEPGHVARRDDSGDVSQQGRGHRPHGRDARGHRTAAGKADHAAGRGR